jgi:hypothetical protein
VDAFSFALLLSLVGKGGALAPAPQAPNPKAISACAAVTRSDVEEALGRAVSIRNDETDRKESTCEYAGPRGQVTITIQRLTEKLNMQAEIASLKAEIPESTVRDVAGIGTRAFFLDIAGAGTQLHVIRGETDFLMVSILGFGEGPSVSTAAETMARKALARF